LFGPDAGLLYRGQMADSRLKRVCKMAMFYEIGSAITIWPDTRNCINRKLFADGIREIV